MWDEKTASYKAMMRLGAVLVLMVPSVAFAATGGTCSMLKEATVRELTGVPAGPFSARAAQVGPGHERCTYGVTDGNLVLNVIQYPDSAAAIAAIPKVGGGGH